MNQYNDLEFYYKAYFNDAQWLDKIRSYISFILIIVTLVAIFLTGTLEIWALIAGCVLQAIIVVVKNLGNISQLLGHEMQRAAMLFKAYQHNDIRLYDIASMKGRLPKRVHKNALLLQTLNKREEYGEDREMIEGKLLAFMVEENSFYNHHLYERTIEFYWAKISVALSSLILVILLAIAGSSEFVTAHLSTTLPAFLLKLLEYLFVASLKSFPKIILIALSFYTLWDLYDKARILRESSKAMGRIYAILRNNKDLKPEDLVHIFSSYIAIKTASPLIPKRVFHNKQKQIKDGWLSSLDDHQNCLRALERIVPELSKLPAKWAITGSFGLYLQDVDIRLSDIDIISDKNGAELIGKALLKNVEKSVEFSQLETVRSHYGLFKFDTVSVDVMGDIENVTEEGIWEPHKEWEKNIVKVNFGDLEVPVLSVQYELEIYRKLKNTERSYLLKKHLEEQERNSMGYFSLKRLRNIF